MKKVIFTLFSFCLLYVNSNAQYCGHTGAGSGSSQCTPSGALTKPGLAPVSDSLPPLVNGTISSTVIQFKNFDTITFGGQTLKVQSIRVDSIGNLPLSTCWATNKASNTWANQEDGCIKVNGNVCSTPGQYRLKIIVTASVGQTPQTAIPIQTDAGAAGLYYYARVKNAGDADQAVDTTGQSANSNIFVAYGPSASCSVGINDVASNINSLSVVPNPFNNKAVVSFYSDKAGVMTERLTNMLGSEVLRKSIEVRMGENSSMIEKNNLPTGVYFYSLSDGKSVATKRVVISE
jgi:hypothetical protein